MRFVTAFGLLASLSALSFASATEAAKPELIVQAFFPENVQSLIVNGEKTVLQVAIERKSAANITLANIGGSLVHPDTGKLIKTLSPTKYGIPLPQNTKLQFPYVFYSESKTGDHRLNIWVEGTTSDGAFKVEAFDSIVTVQEPPFSFFDFKMWSTYAVILAILGGSGFLGYRAFVPQAKKPRAKQPTADVSSPVSATGTGYSEEWIPEHHLRKTKGGKKADVLSGTSADEVSGAETSGTEDKRRKGKK